MTWLIKFVILVHFITNKVVEISYLFDTKNLFPDSYYDDVISRHLVVRVKYHCRNCDCDSMFKFLFSTLL